MNKMKKLHYKALSITLAISLLSPGAIAFGGQSSLTREEVHQHAQETIDYYHENYAKDSYQGLMDWPAVGLSAFGEDLSSPKWTGEDGKNALSFREEEVRNNIGLSTVKNTDFQRTIIGVTAVGKDPTNFGGKDLVATVKGTMLPNGHFADSVEDRKSKRPVGNMLVNAHTFGVISLHTAGQVIPNREKCLAWLLDKQHLDGGYTWDVKSFVDPADAEFIESGVDMTAAALMTMAILGLDRDSDPVKESLVFLKSKQNEQGGFNSWGADNPESCAWVIQALTLLGIDPMGEEWTTEEGYNPVTCLLRFQLDKGSFTHVLNEKDDLAIYDNGMSTEQGLYGLAAAYYNKSVYELQHEKYRPIVAAKLFKDVTPSTPYYKAIMDAVYDYDMKGYNDGRFKPDQAIVNVKFYDALVKGFNLEYKTFEDVKDKQYTYYGDLSESQWGWTSIDFLLDAGLLDGQASFRSADPITKNQAITVAKEMLKWLKGDDVDFTPSIEGSDDYLTNGECAQLISDLQLICL